MPKQLVLIALILMAFNATGQISDTIIQGKITSRLESDGIDENIMELYTERTETSYDFSDLADEFLQLYRHPLNINKATENELRQLHLNDVQVCNILDYISQYGEISGIYELNMIEGFDSVLIRKLEPCIAFKIDREMYKITLPNLINQGKHTVLTRYQRILQLQEGYIRGEADSSSLSLSDISADDLNNYYLGNPVKLLIKYNYNFHNRLKFGITMEKDAGESLSHGFDFYSMHFFYKSKGLIKNLALGDYNLQFGQGLTMHSSFGFAKNPSSSLITRRINQVKSSTGTNESQSLRGGAITLSPFQGCDVTMFYSNRKLDGGITSISTFDTAMNTVGSLIETGLHRTIAEIAKKNTIGQVVYGANVQSRFNIFRIGATVHTTSLTANMNPRDLPYNVFRFRGNKLINFGTDLSVIFRSITAFTEISGSDNGAKALLAGISIQPSNLFGFSLLYRNYATDYQNFFSNAFAENSQCSNEKGIYAGLFAYLNPHLELTAYADHFQFPWLKYLTDAPSYGKEYMFQLKYIMHGVNEFNFRYRYTQNMQNLAGNAALIQYFQLTNPQEIKEDINQNDVADNSELSDVTDFPCPKDKQSFRLNLVYNPIRYLILKNRVELDLFRSMDSNKSTGFLIYQDIIYHNEKSPLLLNLRYALFDTDSYNERIYAYESDILYSFSVPSYYYTGSRFYLMLKYDVSRSLDIWVRYAHSYYSNKNSIGSGLDKIQGNTKSELKLQVIVKL